MFVVLTLECGHRPSVLLHRCMHSCVVERIPVGESWFYHLRHYCSSGRPDWKRLCRLLGREKHRLLFPADLLPPEALGIQRYDASGFCADALTQIFCTVLRAQPMPPGQVALIDREATLQKTAETLLPWTRQLLIYTQDSWKYLDFIRWAERFHGISPILCETGRPLQKAVAVLAPYGTAGLAMPEHAVLFGRAEDGGYHLAEAGLSLPPEVGRLIPQGVSSLEMLAALRERCGILLPIEEICPCLCKGNGKTSVNGLVFAISCLT